MRLYNPLRLTATYQRDDEILQTSWVYGTESEDLTGSYTLTNLRHVITTVGSTFLQTMADYMSARCKFTCLEVFPIEPLPERPYRELQDWAGNLDDGGLMPANCTLNLRLRGSRGGKFVYGGLRLSVLDKGSTEQGVLGSDYVDELLGDVIPAFATPLNLPGISETFYVGIMGDDEVEPLLKATNFSVGEVIGSMRERTGNRPQRRKRPVAP